MSRVKGDAFTRKGWGNLQEPVRRLVKAFARTRGGREDGKRHKERGRKHHVEERSKSQLMGKSFDSNEKEYNRLNSFCPNTDGKPGLICHWTHRRNPMLAGKMPGAKAHPWPLLNTHQRT